MPTQTLYKQCNQQEPTTDLCFQRDAAISSNENLRLELQARRVLSGALAERLAEKMNEPSDAVVCWRVLGIG